MEEEKSNIDNKIKKYKIIRVFIIIGIIIMICLIGEQIYTLVTFDEIVIDTSLVKPIIYIYPTEETKVSVKVGYPENLTCTYPKYDETEGWNVIAEPNGNLKDIKTGRNLYSLYWEGKGKENIKEQSFDEGFVVEGKETADFLEEKLDILGLNEREAEEFIVYWLPILEKNEYNFIRFYEKEEIDEKMPLDINPIPDTTIRVLMGWKKLDEKIDVKEQKLEKAERKGYTVVEWGGTEIKSSIIK